MTSLLFELEENYMRLKQNKIKRPLYYSKLGAELLAAHPTLMSGLAFK